MCRGSTSTQGHGVFQSTCCKRGPQTGNDRKQMPPHEAEKRQAELAASSSEDVHLPWHRKLNKCQLEIPTKNIPKQFNGLFVVFLLVSNKLPDQHIFRRWVGGSDAIPVC